MFSKSAVTRGAQFALKRPALQAAQRRSFAAVATAPAGSASYQTTDVNGIKVVSRDTQGPTTKLAIVVRGGTRFEVVPGLCAGLEEYAFKKTTKRSSLRIHRETELLGGQLASFHTREALVLEASFLRHELPYFAELLAEVLTETSYSTHELNEEVLPALAVKKDRFTSDTTSIALDSAHAVAFHEGLGNAIYPSAATNLSGYLDEHNCHGASKLLFTKSNIAVVADGANPELLKSWTETFFPTLPVQDKELAEAGISFENLLRPTTYFGGEQRTPGGHGNSMVIAFSSDPAKPEFDVLAALLGGDAATISRSCGTSILANLSADHHTRMTATNFKYSDAALFALQLSGPIDCVAGATGAVDALRRVADKVSKEEVDKAIARARFEAVLDTEHRTRSMVTAGMRAISGTPNDITATLKNIESVTSAKIQSAAKSMLEGKASVASAGDLFLLPYASRLGLNV